MKIKADFFLDPIFFPTLIMFAILGVVLVAFKVHHWIDAKKRKRSPFTGKFLRSPGQSLLVQLDDVQDSLTTALVGLVVAPMAIYAGIAPSLFTGRITTTAIVGVAALFVGFCSFFLWRVFQKLKERRLLRLGYEGELATGEELNQLMQDGYRVFHDFPADKFNIDHILIGPPGVFAVETKARSKPISNNAQADVLVTFDGTALNYPNYRDTASVEQARRQATWLGEWLAKATGEKVTVYPILAIPGWYVERIVQKTGILAANPKQVRGALQKVSQNLDHKMIQRISHQVEQKCRDVVPRAYREGEKKD